jgi:response regulator NasT
MLHSSMTESLSIVVIETERDRALLMLDALSEVVEHRIHVISDITGLRRSITRLNPDVVLVDMASRSRDMLEALTLAFGPM